MTNRVFRIGIISDTHGLLREVALSALHGSDLIIHAGDIGSAEIVPALRRIAPVVAVRGNVDKQAWARAFPEREVVEHENQSLYVLHNISELDVNPKAAGFAAVISGHSHKPEIAFKDGVLYFNPGSAGPRRFRLPISAGKIEVGNGELTPELIELAAD